ncbi:MAG: hypothetical protein WD738_04470 [Pirellulales bacterium]
MVTFPLPEGTPGLQLPFCAGTGCGQQINPFDGRFSVDYGREVFDVGWGFDPFQGYSIENPPQDAVSRWAPTLMFDSTSEPYTFPTMSTPMLESQDWVFHMEFVHRGPYGQTAATGKDEFILFAKHVPADSGGTPDGREDRIFAVAPGADANSWYILVGNASGGWSTAISNLQLTIDPEAPQPEQYVDFDVHFRAVEQEMDFYWESDLVGTATTGHGRYDIDFLQWEHKGNVPEGRVWEGSQSFRNFRLGIPNDDVSAPIEGDYNGDGVVDSGDYVVWRKFLNTAGLPGTVTGDGDDGTGTGTPDGIVDEDDYAFWVSRFGATTPLGSGGGSSASAAIPEPAGLILLTVATVLLAPAVRFRA